MSLSQASFIFPDETVAALPTKPWWHRRARHVHIWQDKCLTYYSRPDLRPITLTGFVTQEQVAVITLGFTVVLQRCDCGKYQQEKLMGRLPA